MKNLLLRIFVLAAVALVCSFHAFGQAQCARDYRTCVSNCNTTRDQTRSSNNIARNQIRLQLARDLTQCNVRFVGDREGRRVCRQEAILAANAEIAEHDLSDREADRNRIDCIRECRRRLRECQQPSLPTLSLDGGFTIDCLEGGAPCRGAVSEFCTQAAGACDDCWRSMCGGGEWLIDSEVPLSNVTLVAAQGRSMRGRIVGTSSIDGRRASLYVPRDIRLNAGEQLYFQFSSRTKPRHPVKITIHRDR